MKTFLRIVLILAVAAAICGAALAIVTVTGAQASSSSRAGGFHGGAGFGRGDLGGRAFSLAATAKNLSIIAAIVLAVVGAERLLKLVRPRRPAPLAVRSTELEGKE